METSIQQWGNSLAVRLPRDLTRKLKLRAGSRVFVSPRAHSIVIKPNMVTMHKTLDDLLGEIKTKRRQGEVDWGSPVGKEVW